MLTKKIARIPRTIATLLLLALATLSSDAAPAKPQQYLMYVGTYTLGEKGLPTKSAGIYAYRFDPDTAKLTPLGLAAKTVNPSFVAIHPNRRFLYAVNEVTKYKGQSSGAVSAFSIDQKTGKLTLLNEVASKGADPCYITLDRTGKYVLVANYTGGSVAVFPVRDDGRLGDASSFIQHTGHGPNPARQEEPHAHSIDVSADNRFALADDLGLDQLLVYHFDEAKGSLTPNDPPFAKLPSSAGPRHMAFRPDSKFAYVVNELRSSVTVFAYDPARGALRSLESISTLPKDFTGKNDDAEIEVHSSGKYLYASNRGRDSIAVFAIDEDKGTLTPIQDVLTQGKTPRNFTIDPTGKFLFAANENSNNIVIFRIDEKTGQLTPTGQRLEVPAPVCIRFAAVN